MFVCERGRANAPDIHTHTRSCRLRFGGPRDVSEGRGAAERGAEPEPGLNSFGFCDSAAVEIVARLLGRARKKNKKSQSDCQRRLMSVSCHPGTCKQHAWVALAGCSEEREHAWHAGGCGVAPAASPMLVLQRTGYRLKPIPDGSFQREPCGSVCLIRCVFPAAYQRGDPSVPSLRLLPFACLIQPPRWR